LAPFAIFAEAMVLEIGTDFGFIVVVELPLASEFFVGMGEGALDSFESTN